VRLGREYGERNMVTKEYYREYRLKHLEKIRIRNRKYAKDWRAKHPDRVEEYEKKRPKRPPYQFEKKLLNKIADRDGKKCKNCGTSERLTIQHKLPRCMGGKNNLENLEILCLKCNIKDYQQLVKKALAFYFENKS
jgi:5-methylcytosine-specific restriction endonuclease McrA